MADSGLTIRIGADVAPAIQGLQQVEQRMRSTVAAGQSFGKGIDKSVQSLSKLPGSSNRATQSLINLSRVAQDAPYGFIGIANNINPLLESFQLLKASTGTTGGAMQALKSALIGPAGVGLAVGVVSSLLVVFGDRLFGSSKRTKELKEEAERLQKVLSEVSKTKTDVTITGGANAAEEIAKASALVKIIGDQTNSYKTRNAALVQLQGINKNYFGDLDIEKTSVSQLTKLVNEYSNALIAQETIKLLGGDIAKLYVEQGKALNKYNADLKELAKAEQELRKAQSYQEVDRNGNVIYTYGAKVLAAQKKVDGFNKSLSSSGKSIQQVNDQIVLSNELLKSAYLESLKFKPLTSVSVGADKATIKPEKVNLDFSLAKYGRLELPVGTAVLRMQELLLDKPKQLTFAETLQNSLTEKISKLVVTPNIKVAENKDLKAAAERRMALEKMEADVVINTLTPAFDSMFAALGKGENAFRAFGQAAIQALTQLIGKLITTTALASILGPLLGLSAGGVAGATGFKDWFKLLIGGARATGGPVTGGTSYMVGERGPEVFVPSVSGSIVPNNQLGSFSTGRSSSSGGSMRAIVRGQNILLAVARTTRGNSRLGLNGI